MAPSHILVRFYVLSEMHIKMIFESFFAINGIEKAETTLFTLSSWLFIEKVVDWRAGSEKMMLIRRTSIIRKKKPASMSVESRSA